jgi:hypothetical protein
MYKQDYFQCSKYFTVLKEEESKTLSETKGHFHPFIDMTIASSSWYKTWRTEILYLKHEKYRFKGEKRQMTIKE